MYCWSRTRTLISLITLKLTLWLILDRRLEDDLMNYSVLYQFPKFLKRKYQESFFAVYLRTLLTKQAPKSLTSTLLFSVRNWDFHIFSPVN